jgi:hypothetical protein
LISTFALRVETSDKIPAMLDEGVKRIDAIYSDALAMGMLRPDPSLIETPVIDPSLIENATDAATQETTGDNETQAVPDATVTASTITVQFETPDVGSVSDTEVSVRGVPGVRSATTTSLALGGTLGVIAVSIHHEIVLGIVGGLFVMEAVSVIVQVFVYKRTGKRVFRMAPIHHHFEQLGWKESTVVIRFWIVSIVLALIGLATLKVR